MRAASMGVRVRATKRDTITATDTVTPNSVSMLAIIPLAKITGRNTAATEKVAATAAKVISRVPTEAASGALFPPPPGAVRCSPAR